MQIAVATALCAVRDPWSRHDERPTGAWLQH